MSKKFGNKFFEIGMLASFDMLGYFNFVGTRTNRDMDLVVSLPLYCQMTGASISELDFEKYLIRLKPEKVYRKLEHMGFIIAKLLEVTNEEGAMVGNEDETYKNFFHFEHFQKLY